MSCQTPTPGDFTATPRIIRISLLAVFIGVIGTGVAWLLLRLIGPRGQHLYPIIDAERHLDGVITRKHLRKLPDDPSRRGCDDGLADLASTEAVVAHPDEPLRVVVYRMAETGYTRLPVVEASTRNWLG